jgi:hypothetical protein
MEVKIFMARSKRTSTVLDTARQRLAGLKSITPAPEYGPTLALSDYERDIEALSTKLDSYNEELSSVDQTLNEFEAAEDGLREKNRRMLSATEAHYGPDSSEYEQVGGTRTSDRKSQKSRGTSPTAPPA